MRGVGTASAAVSFLNGLFTGTGASAGITLEARAKVVFDRAPDYHLDITSAPDSPLLRAMVERTVGLWAADSRLHGAVTIESSIPVEKGLKSSSATSCAVGKAVSDAFGRSDPPIEIARISASVAKDSGQSATGAFDDCLASVEPGIHVVDNAQRRPLRTLPAKPEWRVLILVPGGSHPPSPSVRTRFEEFGSRSEEVLALLENGEPLRALELNSSLVEQALGYAYGPLRRQLASAGALASGVSGLGPAIVSIVEEDRVRPVSSVLASRGGRVLEAQFTSGTTAHARSLS